MWKIIEKKFSKDPAQREVAKLLYTNGLSVDEHGVHINGIRIPNTRIAEKCRVDRKVVSETIKNILSNDQLRKFFENLRAYPELSNVASEFGYGVLVIYPKDAKKKGILSQFIQVLTSNNLTIRQALAEDPESVDEAKLIIITNEKIPSEVASKLLQLKDVDRIELR